MFYHCTWDHCMIYQSLQFLRIGHDSNRSQPKESNSVDPNYTLNTGTRSKKLSDYFGIVPVTHYENLLRFHNVFFPPLSS